MTLIERLKADEGYRRYAYNDHLGNLTIGYGTMIESPGQGVSPAMAELMLKERIDQIYESLGGLEWFASLDDGRQEVMVEMAYQMGVNGLLGFRRMIAALIREDWYEAAEEALDSLWAEQTPARAKRAADRILGDE